jgi:glycosyltransferase involved in cell wall biosynthesis
LDIGGGAEKISWNLLHAYWAAGHQAWLAVGRKISHDPNVLLIPPADHNQRSRLRRSLLAYSKPQVGQSRTAALARRVTRALAEPSKALDSYLGIEDFRFPASRQLLSLPRQRPDIVHGHNLHGHYFDLRVLQQLSDHVPLMLTLHDAWLLSGHCAHSLECERWRIGCGHCPDLTLDPGVQRDATAYNWRRKRDIFQHSRLWIATPSRWLMQKVEQSMLAPAIVERRVIPNGVDLSIFHPANQYMARSALGLPADAAIVVFAANAVRRNTWKDYQTLRTAVGQLAAALIDRTVLFIALGEDGPTERIGAAEVRFVPFVHSPEDVARYYQAADIYIHAARADTFPNSVLEALACGVPVIATAVGGIPEQIEDEVTGFLVPGGDAQSIAVRARQVLTDTSLRRFLGVQASETARQHFDLRTQASSYLAWYEELLDHRPHDPSTKGELQCVART